MARNCNCCKGLKSCHTCHTYIKICDLNDVTLLLVTHDDMGEFRKEVSLHTKQPEAVFILQKDAPVEVHDIINAIESQNIDCPRCRRVVEHAQKLVRNVPCIDYSTISGICNHCRMKIERNKCAKSVVAVILHNKLGEKMIIDDNFKVWLSNIENEFRKLKNCINNIFVNDKETGIIKSAQNYGILYESRDEKNRKQLNTDDSKEEDIRLQSEDKETQFLLHLTKQNKTALKDDKVSSEQNTRQSKLEDYVESMLKSQLVGQRKYTNADIPKDRKKRVTIDFTNTKNNFETHGERTAHVSQELPNSSLGVPDKKILHLKMAPKKDHQHEVVSDSELSDDVSRNKFKETVDKLLVRPSRSYESLLDLIQRPEIYTKETASRDLKYYFPHTDKKRMHVKQVSSSELIKKTRDYIQERNEEKRKKYDLERKNIEKKREEKERRERANLEAQKDLQLNKKESISQRKDETDTVPNNKIDGEINELNTNENKSEFHKQFPRKEKENALTEDNQGKIVKLYKGEKGKFENKESLEKGKTINKSDEKKNMDKIEMKKTKEEPKICSRGGTSLEKGKTTKKSDGKKNMDKIEMKKTKEEPKISSRGGDKESTQEGKGGKYGKGGKDEQKDVDKFANVGANKKKNKNEQLSNTATEGRVKDKLLSEKMPSKDTPNKESKLDNKNKQQSENDKGLMTDKQQKNIGSGKQGEPLEQSNKANRGNTENSKAQDEKRQKNQDSEKSKQDVKTVSEKMDPSKKIIEEAEKALKNMKGEQNPDVKVKSQQPPAQVKEPEQKGIKILDQLPEGLQVSKVKPPEVPKKVSYLRIEPTAPMGNLLQREENIPGQTKTSERCLDINEMVNLRHHKSVKENTDIIIATSIHKFKPSLLIQKEIKEDVVPILFKKTYDEFPLSEKDMKTVETPPSTSPHTTFAKNAKQAEPQEPPKGVIRYALSDRSFIEKGWTMLPTEKVVRKMNIYRMRPAHPEFDWFEHNKNKGIMCYDTGEKLAQFDDKGRGRWFYRNGRVALDYYDAEEINAQQRVVIYSSGEPDERGRSRPITILGTFDYLGNGVVFDHFGKIRLKYNQTEGVVLDRSLGPVSQWKWHSLNDPPVLQQVMIDTQLPVKDPLILRLGDPHADKPRQDNEEMLAIEFDNFIKEKSKKLSQSFKPFQIKMKALKINERFSLRVLDQASVHLLFRDGGTNLKLNLGMRLDHQEIVDTDTAEVGSVAVAAERRPARTPSLARIQEGVALAVAADRARAARALRLRPAVPGVSADRLRAPCSRPLRTAAGPACAPRRPPPPALYCANTLL